MAPKNPNPAVTVLPKTEKSPALPDDVNDSNTAYDTSVISTCTSLQVRPHQTGSTGGAGGHRLHPAGWENPLGFIQEDLGAVWSLEWGGRGSLPVSLISW